MPLQCVTSSFTSNFLNNFNALRLIDNNKFGFIKCLSDYINNKYRLRAQNSLAQRKCMIAKSFSNQAVFFSFFPSFFNRFNLTINLFRELNFNVSFSLHFSCISKQVFGLGNKTYEHYNKVAIYVDKRLEELGATRVFELGLGDDDAK